MPRCRILLGYLRLQTLWGELAGGTEIIVACHTCSDTVLCELSKK